MTLLLTFIQSIYFFLPAYFSNMAPVIFKPVNILYKPVNQKWFGKNKTIGGLIYATITGSIIFYIQKILYNTFNIFNLLSPINYNDYTILLGVLLASGAILGDLMKSFFKRRIGVKPGDPWLPFDHIDYLIGSFLFISIIFIPSLKMIISILVFTLIVHPIANYLCYITGFKDKKW